MAQATWYLGDRRDEDRQHGMSRRHQNETREGKDTALPAPRDLIGEGGRDFQRYGRRMRATRRETIQEYYAHLTTSLNQCDVSRGSTLVSRCWVCLCRGKVEMTRRYIGMKAGWPSRCH